MINFNRRHELDELIKRSKERLKTDNPEAVLKAKETIGQFNEKLKKNICRDSISVTVMLVIPLFVLFAIADVLVRRHFGECCDWATVFKEVLMLLPTVPLIFAIIFLVVRRSNSKMICLCEALEEAAQGNLDLRLNENSAGSFARAYEDYNSLCESFKNSETDLMRAVEIANESNIAKSRFLSGMSHEIRTPLNTVLGVDEMILRESREEKIRDYAKNIQSAGVSLLEIINEILDSSKIETGKLEIIESEYGVAKLLTDVCDIIHPRAEMKELFFEINIDENLPSTLWGDGIRIKQIILNLLSNAVKYTETGSITLGVSFVEDEGDEILLSVFVADTGIGIKHENLERLYEPFERIEAEKVHSIEGAGLGLSITKQLLNLMGSDVSVKSSYGKGSIFSFVLRQKVVDKTPIGCIIESEKEKKKKESGNAYTESFHAPNAHVLAVDDSKVNLMIIEGLLKDTMINLTLVESGEECITKCLTEKYDLIFLDHMMPGMDGLETLVHIKNEEGSLNVETPVIALTANAVEGAREEYVHAGFNDYLSKPIDSKILEIMIRHYLSNDKIEAVTEENAAKHPEDLEAPKESIIDKIRDGVPEIDIQKGLECSGNEELYTKVLSEFYETGESRADKIELLFEQQDIKNYTIEVHALKSTSRIIGDLTLSKLAEDMEMAGKAENVEEIEAHTKELLTMYRELTEKLKPFFCLEEDLPEIEEAALKDAFSAIREVIDGFDFDSADAIMQELKGYKMPEKYANIFKELKTMVSEVERDGILELLGKL